MHKLTKAFSLFTDSCLKHWSLWLVLAALVLGANSCQKNDTTHNHDNTDNSTIGSVAPGPPGPLPEMPSKPHPAEITFDGCPPEGDGGDPALNRLKNRVDENTYIPVLFDLVVHLPWPPAIERKKRSNWSTDDSKAVARYEGVPIAVEGYLAGAKLEGPESPNCHGADEKYRDFHVWLTKSADDDRNSSIVVETTPRV